MHDNRAPRNRKAKAGSADFPRVGLVHAVETLEDMRNRLLRPDFVKLAESYGAKGIRVMKKEDIAAAFEEAKKNTKTPTLIEFVINPEELVYPMVQPGGTLEDLIMDC